LLKSNPHESNNVVGEKDSLGFEDVVGAGDPLGEKEGKSDGTSVGLAVGKSVGREH